MLRADFFTTVLMAFAIAGLGSPRAASASDADPDAVVQRLAEAVRIRTVSPQTPADFDAEPFLAFHAFLERSFPRAHGALEREIVADYSLLYTWRGSDTSLQPVLLTSHQDVVPVVPASLERWTYPPFSGAVAEGFVWGRGTLDDKVALMATLEAVESLVAAGFQPSRTVYLAFGHDEELGGDAGAKAITDLLESRGVRLWFSLDEGMVIVDGMAGLEEPIAMIGVAEKGYMTLELIAHAQGGHSSMPPRESAIGRLATAIGRVEASPLPAHLEGVAGDLFDALAPMLPAGQRFAIGQRWLLGPFLVSALSDDPATNAMIRTTTAVTIVRGGVKANVLPSEATATVNFRIHPGDTFPEVVEFVREAVDDPEIEIEVVRASNASPVSSSSSEAFAALSETIGEVFGGLPVVPALVVGGTDSKHYGRIADDAYRFAPIQIGLSDRTRVHGVDERIAIDVYREAPAFYQALIRRVAGRAGD